ncbi:MAG: molecular chaperone TorD family protein [Armatimonadota bacterium]|nr:molecular chaperone TorD family protein [Armatimonadota bacterium]MDR7520380.1 molecular chaperone TorD family protein [Armatimonadota bacterium]MDR7550005.1 molecular chaperone TorD family protein [Armatimonadota bacterium]
MTDAPVLDLEGPRRLLLKGQAYGLCARMLAPDTDGSPDGETLARLRDVLERLEFVEPLARLSQAVEAGNNDPEAIQDEHLRLFIKGEAPPYGTSYDAPPSSAPRSASPQQLADVAGFYNAFGFQAAGDRPDHLAAELEYVALLCVKEAFARLAQQEEGAAVCAEARSKFLAEHLVPWLPAFGQHVGRSARHPYFVSLASLVISLVEADRQETAGA